MQPYINMRTVSNPDQFRHIIPLAISCIMTQGTTFKEQADANLNKKNAQFM